MSVQAHRVLTHPNLPELLPSDLLVLCRILAHLNEKSGIARPSIDTLAKLISGVDEKARGVGKTRTVQRAIRRIEAAGIMRVEVGGGAGEANRYHFTNPVTKTDTVSKSKPRHHVDTLSDPKPRHTGTKRVTDQALNPDNLGVTRTEERRNGEGAARDNWKHFAGIGPILHATRHQRPGQAASRLSTHSRPRPDRGH